MRVDTSGVEDSSPMVTPPSPALQKRVRRGPCFNFPHKVTPKRRRQRGHRHLHRCCPPKVSRSMERLNRRFVELVSPLASVFSRDGILVPSAIYSDGGQHDSTGFTGSGMAATNFEQILFWLRGGDC